MQHNSLSIIPDAVEECSEIDWDAYARAYDYFYAPTLKKTHAHIAKGIVEGRVLDLGCGVGKMLSHLPKHVDYTGIDTCQSMLELAREKGKERPYTRFQEQTMLELPFLNASMDTIITCNALYALTTESEVEEVLRESQRVLVPNGIIKIVTPNTQLTHDFLVDEIRRQCSNQVIDQRSAELYDIFVGTNSIIGKRMESGEFNPLLFTQEKMGGLLEKVGFTVNPNSRRDLMEGTSLYVDARKNSKKF